MSAINRSEARELARMMGLCDMCQLHEAHIALKDTELESVYISIGIQREEIGILKRRVHVLYLALFAAVLVAAWAVMRGF